MPAPALRKVHFIGIAGAGMSAVAKLLRDSGAVVSGSDEGVYPPVSDFLTQQNIPYVTTFVAKNIPADADTIVIGKNARLVPATNPEVAAAFSSGKTILSFPEVLNQLAQGKDTIVVAGSYGKSSCTALLAHALESAGLDPSFFIGAIPLTPNDNARLGKGEFFVLEGDEYPSSNTDVRAKFLHYRPKHLLLVPLAHDHVNIYPTPADYLKPFEQLIGMTGSITFCVDGPLSAAFRKNLPQGAVTYGLNAGTFHAANIRWGERTRFDLMYGDAVVAKLETSQLGEHSVQNIVGVGAFLLSQNIMSAEAYTQAVTSFKGVQRRLDRKSDKTSIPIFEGFGSSREKAQSAIAAVNRHFPDRKLVVIFEPHAFSWRNREFLPWYDDAFKGANKVYVYEPATQGAASHDQLSQQEIVARIAGTGVAVTAITGGPMAIRIAEDTKADDAVLFLTSGNLGGIIKDLPVLLEKKFAV